MHLPNETNFCNVSKITNCCDSSSSSSLDLQLQLINVFLCCRPTRTPHLPDLICRLLQKTLANLGATEDPALRKCSEMAFQNTRSLEQTAWKKPTAKVSVKLYIKSNHQRLPGPLCGVGFSRGYIGTGFLATSYFSPSASRVFFLFFFLRWLTVVVFPIRTANRSVSPSSTVEQLPFTFLLPLSVCFEPQHLAEYLVTVHCSLHLSQALLSRYVTLLK